MMPVNCLANIPMLNYSNLLKCFNGGGLNIFIDAMTICQRQICQMTKSLKVRVTANCCGVGMF
jgi:hypothetical protein